MYGSLGSLVERENLGGDTKSIQKHITKKKRQMNKRSTFGLRKSRVCCHINSLFAEGSQLVCLCWNVCTVSFRDFCVALGVIQCENQYQTL